MNYTDTSLIIGHIRVLALRASIRPQVSEFFFQGHPVRVTVTAGIEYGLKILSTWEALSALQLASFEVMCRGIATLTFGFEECTLNWRIGRRESDVSVDGVAA
jgi:hypothetical protein